MIRCRKEQKQLEENAYLLRAWKKWHRKELEQASHGPHGDVIERLMAQLKILRVSCSTTLRLSAGAWSIPIRA